MMRISRHVFVTTAFLTLCGASATLQAQTFQRVIGGGFDDRPSCVETTTDNGYIISGDLRVAIYI